MKQLFVVFFTLCWCLLATLTISSTLGSNMVLQREPLQAQIWGWDDAGTTITVTFNNQSITGTTSTDGSWVVSLPATPAGGTYDIGISSSSGGSTSLTNVLFGDVYLCSGQSNMQFTVDMAFNASFEIALADKYPNIRVFTVGQSTISPTPLSNLATVEQGWSVASSTSIGNGNWTYMSAVCWFFGRDLYDQYQVPIGLVSSNWAGTYIQTWASPEVLAQCNVTTPPFNASGGANQPSVLYNAMIVPLLPLSITGAVWYQGESNVGEAPLYACLQPAMIADWRSKFGNGNGFRFPFFFVMIGPWSSTLPASVPVADLRASQLAALSQPSVGYASAFDLGDPDSPFGSIHPRDKQEVGSRLVLAARNIAYGETSVVWQGPTFNSATQSEQDHLIKIAVTFSTYGGAGLYYQLAACPQGIESDTCTNWQIQLGNGNWYTPTDVTSADSSNVVVVTYQLPLFSKGPATGIRYAYSIWPLATLYCAEGLPAVPFEYYFSSN